MKRVLGHLSAFALGLQMIACGNDDADGGSMGGSTMLAAGNTNAGGQNGGAVTAGDWQGGDGASGGDEGGGTDGGGIAPLGTPPEAPVISSVMKMGGNLHVSWTLPDDPCDQVALFRKHDSGDYQLAYTLTGVATSQHDAGAVASGEYCYEIVCRVGDLQSDYSNEMCGTP
jgi:hypothetical protein